MRRGPEPGEEGQEEKAEDKKGKEDQEEDLTRTSRRRRDGEGREGHLRGGGGHTNIRDAHTCPVINKIASEDIFPRALEPVWPMQPPGVDAAEAAGGRNSHGPH